VKQPIEYGPEVLANPEASLTREWLETNGIGGFASSTIWGLNTRRYHSLLTAALKPPLGRMVLLSKLEEAVIVDGERFELSTNRYPGVLYPQGFQYLVNFRLDPFPVFRFDLGRIVIEKTVFMPHGQNTTVVQYTLVEGCACILELRPLMAFRDHHSLTHQNAALHAGFVSDGNHVTFQPYGDLARLHLMHEQAAIEKTSCWYWNFEYDRERERGLDFTEDLFNPFLMRLRLLPGTTRSIVATTSEQLVRQAGEMREAELWRRRQIAVSTPAEAPLVQTLVAAADQYLVDRGDGETIIAGYHWFGDWGRDTMVALPGITLVTGRHDAARAILSEFAKYVSRGMLPNRFPDSGEAPEYNTVDAALWFFEAARAYLAYTLDEQFVLRELYPKLKEIINWYLAGTHHGIHVESDGLVYAGEAGTQLTWMDAKVGDWVVTPRIGKPVEVQALWYNALRVQQSLARAAGDSSAELFLREMAEYVRVQFNRLFWNDEYDCLYDVVNGDARDGSIRPNQVFAVSLAHPLVNEQRGRKILRVVEQHLLTPLGLRSLAPSDPAYRPHYSGGVASRDSAYHQGTVWPWLIGPFITAYLRIHGSSPEVRATVQGWLSGFDEHLRAAGLGHISEVADAAPPHNPAGCVAQAWSVAELLRTIVEDVLQIAPTPVSTATVS
jgi:predicted glycogen debranching enzyme